MCLFIMESKFFSLSHLDQCWGHLRRPVKWDLPDRSWEGSEAGLGEGERGTQPSLGLMGSASSSSPGSDFLALASNSETSWGSGDLLERVRQLEVGLGLG